MSKEITYQIFKTDEQEFKSIIGRFPKKGELESFAHYLGKGIEAQLDWDMIYDEAKRLVGDEEEPNDSA